MEVLLPRSDWLLLRDGITMFVHVPSGEVAKAVLDGPASAALATLDCKVECLIAESRGQKEQLLELDLGEREIAVAITVIESDARQCGANDDASTRTNYLVNFQADREAVESLLAKVRKAGRMRA
jgi:hypothetical protein